MPVETARDLAAELASRGWQTRVTVVRGGKLHKWRRLRGIAALMREMRETQRRPFSLNLMCGVVEPDLIEFADASVLVASVAHMPLVAGSGVDAALAYDGNFDLFHTRLKHVLASALKPRKPPFANADVNLVAWDNGVGLTRDLSLLAEALTRGGLDVEVTRLCMGHAGGRRSVLERLAGVPGLDRNSAKRFKIAIMLEHVRSGLLGESHLTAFIPNPEWCLPRDVALLGDIDHVLAKTRHAEPIFRSLGCKTDFIGFTSEDRMDASVARSPLFLHVAGKSEAKNTRRVLDLWRRHPEWPHLTVIQNPAMVDAAVVAPNVSHRLDHVSDDELKQLQNAHVFHLCPSIAEGFGHYIAEAMSVGAIVLTTDGAPMNELVGQDSGLLIPVVRTGTQNLSTTHFVDDQGLEEAVLRAMRLTAAEIEARRINAREQWVRQREAFFEGAPQVVKRILAEAGV